MYGTGGRSENHIPLIRECRPRKMQLVGSDNIGNVTSETKGFLNLTYLTVLYCTASLQLWNRPEASTSQESRKPIVGNRPTSTGLNIQDDTSSAI